MDNVKLYEYAIVKFGANRLWFCKAPFGYSIESGDVVDVDGVHGKGKVLAVEMATESNTMLNLLAKINDPEGAEKITAVYRKKEIEWGTDDE